MRRGRCGEAPVSAARFALTVDGVELAARKSSSVVMYDNAGKPVARYHLEQAWPSVVEIGALKAGASEVAMETVTIVAERIQRVSP